MDQRLDYLFVDEAGQVSLGNFVAMGVAARNIVLVGDQMQLSQPIQGDHPMGTGRSVLEHLMDDQATVPPDRGIFLSKTRRLHPDICRFISEAVYDGRLVAYDTTAERMILPAAGIGEPIRSAGVSSMCVNHVGNTQRSAEEATAIAEIYADLLKCSWKDGSTTTRLTPEEILVVSPYNMQVDLLKSTLPAGARVGTVDKFQGQEGAVVLISMATSSGDDLSRQIEFLFSRNRLNVAISRAKCLAIVVACPRLLEVTCSTVAQMQLVNTLCFAKAYSAAA